MHIHFRAQFRNPFRQESLHGLILPGAVLPPASRLEADGHPGRCRAIMDFVRHVMFPVVWFLATQMPAQVITTVGNSVGIGTTAPGRQLDVVGAGSADAYIRILGGSGGTKGGLLVGNNDGGSKEYGGLYFNNADNTVVLNHRYTQGYLGLGANLRTSDVVILASNGNVGIGTANPQNKLSVDATGALGFFRAASDADMVGIDYLHVDGGAGDLMRFRSSVGTANFNRTNMVIARTTGNVGIGTTSPVYRLHIDGTTGTPVSQPLTVDLGDNGSIAVRGSSSMVYAGFTSYKDTTQMWFAGREGDNYVLRTGTGVNVLTAEHSGAVASTLYLKGGNVGIGTSNPGGRLVVDQAGSNTAGSRKTLVFSRTGSGGEFSIGSNAGGSLVLDKVAGTALADIMSWTQAGNVGIGTSSPGYKLEVAGSVRATSFISNTTTYADFVFKPGYQLASLAEVEQHINRHGTLPGVPSEAQVAKEGIDLAAMQVKLLQKVEELTLHQIAQEKRVAALERENTLLREQVAGLAKNP